MIRHRILSPFAAMLVVAALACQSADEDSEFGQRPGQPRPPPLPRAEPTRRVRPPRAPRLLEVLLEDRQQPVSRRQRLRDEKVNLGNKATSTICGAAGFSPAEGAPKRAATLDA